MPRFDPQSGQTTNPMIVTNGRFLVLGEVYFVKDLPPLTLDRVLVMQAPVPMNRSRSEVFHTRVLDLREEPSALWRGIRKGCRYEIRRAKSADGVQCVGFTRPSAAVAERFRRFHHEFALAKGISPVDANWLAAGVVVGAVELSCASDSEGRELVWHSYYRGADRVRLLHSASMLPGETDADLRGLIGRANRRLHWEDMEFFRSEGVATYDLGGWYAGRQDHGKLGINAFKEQFGGQVVEEYNCDLPLTTRAKVFACVPERLRRLASGNRHGAQLDVQ